MNEVRTEISLKFKQLVLVHCHMLSEVLVDPGAELVAVAEKPVVSLR